MKVLVLGNALKEGVIAEVDRQLPMLRRHLDVVLVDLRQEKPLPDADLALVFGGDGAILRAARQMGYRQVPVLGVNLGRLGFLADVSPEELEASVEQITAGRGRVTHHVMYECVLEDPKAASSQTFLGLNEVVLHTLPPFHILDLSLTIDGVNVARFAGDGLIISTPIGSTAHNLSAGGPILGQELDAFVITPICPHTLTYRPLAESAASTYQVRLNDDSEGAVAIFDGQESRPLGPEHVVTIRRAPVRFHLMKTPGRSYYQTLRDKLRWATLPGYRGQT
ncbi:MAG: NAD(+)/NADH kinase [Gemmataceae bacterium]|nr:NAD(+)/NADH kinase [Gemmataceae bacterium]